MTILGDEPDARGSRDATTRRLESPRERTQQLAMTRAFHRGDADELPRTDAHGSIAHSDGATLVAQLRVIEQEQRFTTRRGDGRAGEGHHDRLLRIRAEHRRAE